MTRRGVASGVAMAASTIAAAGAVAGCGGSDTRLTHEAFLSQGNAICAEGNKQIEEGAGAVFTSPDKPTVAEIRTFAETVVLPSVRDTLDQLRALAPPEEDEARVEEILAAAQEAVDKVESDPASLVDDEGFDEFDRLATAYDLTACATE